MYHAKYVSENGVGNCRYTREKQIRDPNCCDTKQLGNEMTANVKQNDNRR
jgi:hypothetical protein